MALNFPPLIETSRRSIWPPSHFVAWRSSLLNATVRTTIAAGQLTKIANARSPSSTHSFVFTGPDSTLPTRVGGPVHRHDGKIVQRQLVTVQTSGRAGARESSQSASTQPLTFHELHHRSNGFFIADVG